MTQEGNSEKQDKGVVLAARQEAGGHWDRVREEASSRVGGATTGHPVGRRGMKTLILGWPIGSVSLEAVEQQLTLHSPRWVPYP